MNPKLGKGPGAPGQIDAGQQLQTESYVPTYTIKPEFQKAVLAAIGKYPFNQIQQVMTAVKVNKMDHNQLTQIMNALGGFPYQDIAGLMETVNNYLVMDEPVDEDEPTEIKGEEMDALEAAIEKAPEDKESKNPEMSKNPEAKAPTPKK